MRTIVTGGAGFIGSHVVEALLARGDEVHVVDNLASGRRENVPAAATLHERDVREPLADLFDEVQPEACFHLAAQADVRISVEKPVFDAEVNLIGTIRVLEAARRHRTRVVFSSTGGAIYGECERPAREGDPRRPLAPYGTSKLAGEEYLLTYNRLYGSSHVVMRFGNVYGPRQDPHGEAGVVAIFCQHFARGSTPRIFGDGTQTRDYVHAADVAAATLAALDARSAVYNVGSGEETSVLELFEVCRRFAGADAEPEFAPARAGELDRSVLDPSLAERELGWRRRYDLESGLAETWAWIASTVTASQT